MQSEAHLVASRLAQPAEIATLLASDFEPIGPGLNGVQTYEWKRCRTVHVDIHVSALKPMTVPHFGHVLYLAAPKGS